MAQRGGAANRRRSGGLLSALLGGALMVACSQQARLDWPNNGVGPPIRDMAIHDTASGRNLAFADAIDKLAKADIVLLGEQHDNPEHHRLQADIAHALAARGRRLVIAFEMIDGSQQALLDGFLASRPHHAAGLGDLLGWAQSGWLDWALYRPIADAALTQADPPARPIRTANLPIAMARDIARNGLAAGGLDDGLAETLRKASARDPAVLAAHARDIGDSHCGMLPERALAPFALAQYARDAVMADSILAARDDSPEVLVLLIAGNGHVRRDVGVPLHAARLQPALKVLSVGLVEDEAPRVGAPFDIVWRTAPLDREDPCEAFRRPVR